MFDATRLLKGLVTHGLSGGGSADRLMRLATGSQGGAGVLARAGVPGGALGLLGGLAIAAYEHYSEQSKATGGAQPYPDGHRPPPPPLPHATSVPPLPHPAVAPPPLPTMPAAAVTAPEAGDPDAPQAEALLLIEAMIAAAKADGVVDREESARIVKRLEQSGASFEERAYVMTELAKPLDVETLVDRVNGPTLAAEVYAASLLAVKVDTDAEKAYFLDLRTRLGLPATTIQQIHSVLNVPDL